MLMPKYMVYARLGRDSFKYEAYTLPYAKRIFDSHTEDKATEVKIVDYDTSEKIAHSRRGKIIE